MKPTDQTEFDLGERLLSVAEVADRFDVTERTVRLWVRQGRLATQRVNRRLFFSQRESRALRDQEVNMKTDLPFHRLVTVREVAGYFGVQEATVRGWARRGFLPTMRRRGCLCFEPAEVARFESLRRQLQRNRR